MLALRTATVAEQAEAAENAGGNRQASEQNNERVGQNQAAQQHSKHGTGRATKGGGRRNVRAELIFKRLARGTMICKARGGGMYRGRQRQSTSGDARFFTSLQGSRTSGEDFRG